MTEQSDDLGARVGAPLELVGIAVRRASVSRPGGLDPQLFTTDARSLVERGDIDVVVEVMGGVEPARSLILAALERGASVVTANKALLAEDGSTVFAAAEKAGRDVYFEAAVAGAIPILRPLRESLAGDRVTKVIGIVNGTTNFVLDQMDTSGADFAAALTQAQALGFAEADPSADIDGFDAAAKAAILASLAFHTRVTTADVHREGIGAVTSADIAWAQTMGRVVKLLAICERVDTPDGAAIAVRVHPAMIPRLHPLAGVHEAYNAVFVESEAAGRLMFYGPGAGGTPTASAVLGDVVAAGAQPPAGPARSRGVCLRRVRDPADGRHPHPLLHCGRRRRPRRRPGCRGGQVRCQRCVAGDRAARGPGGRGAARTGHAHSARLRPVRNGCRPA
jgi:homoserine dehydrogenase